MNFQQMTLLPSLQKTQKPWSKSFNFSLKLKTHSVSVHLPFLPPVTIDKETYLRNRASPSSGILNPKPVHSETLSHQHLNIHTFPLTSVPHSLLPFTTKLLGKYYSHSPFPLPQSPPTPQFTAIRPSTGGIQRTICFLPFTQTALVKVFNYILIAKFSSHFLFVI